MPGTATIPDIEIIVERTGGGGGSGLPPGGDDGDGRGGGEGDGGDRDRRRPGKPPSPKRYYTAIALGLISILMFFMALSAAFLLRRATGSDWSPIHLPLILWFNTMVLLASSFTLELARKRLASANLLDFRKLWMVTTSFGVLFLIGQLMAWRQLVAEGVYMASNPASSFFYIFTGAHGVHLLGGVAALGFVWSRKMGQSGIPLPTAAEITSYYWHFMDGLWIFLLALLYLGK